MQHMQFYSMGVEQSAKEAACERMTHVISEHAADIARILGIQLKGDDLSASLLANIAMCAAENRLIRNPAQTCRDLISLRESRGEPMSTSEQDELCQEALELIPFWGGKDSMPVAKVFWNMVYSGRYPLYNSHAWHERMAQIDTVLRGDKGLMQGFRSMSEAAEHLGAVRKSGGRDDVLHALAGFLAARSQYHSMRSNALRSMGIDLFDKVRIKLDRDEDRLMEYKTGPAGYSRCYDIETTGSGDQCFGCRVDSYFFSDTEIEDAAACFETSDAAV